MSAPERSFFKLYNERQRSLAVKAVESVPLDYAVEIKPPTRTLPQNALLHALLTEAVAGGLATDDGRRLTVDEAKVAFVSAWMIEEGMGSDIVAFGGHAIQLRRSTATLSKDEFSSLVEFIHAALAHRGIRTGEA